MPPAHDFADRSAIRRSLLNGDTLRQTRRTLFSVSLGVVAKKHVMHVVEPRLLRAQPAGGAHGAADVPAGVLRVGVDLVADGLPDPLADRGGGVAPGCA